TRARLRKLAARTDVQSFAYQTTRVKDPDGEWVETPAAAIDIAQNTQPPEDSFQKGLDLLMEADQLELGSPEYLAKVEEAQPMFQEAADEGGDRSGDAAKVLEILDAYLAVDWPQAGEEEDPNAAPAEEAKPAAKPAEEQPPAPAQPAAQPAAPAQQATAAEDTLTFAFNPDQWRNPHNGQWIDMPGRILNRLDEKYDAAGKASEVTGTAGNREKVVEAKTIGVQFVDDLNDGGIEDALGRLDNITELLSEELDDVRDPDGGLAQVDLEMELQNAIDKIDQLKHIDWFSAPIDGEGIGSFDEPGDMPMPAYEDSLGPVEAEPAVVAAELPEVDNEEAPRWRDSFEEDLEALNTEYENPTNESVSMASNAILEGDSYNAEHLLQGVRDDLDTLYENAEADGDESNEIEYLESALNLLDSALDDLRAETNLRDSIAENAGYDSVGLNQVGVWKHDQPSGDWELVSRNGDLILTVERDGELRENDDAESTLRSVRVGGPEKGLPGDFNIVEADFSELNDKQLKQANGILAALPDSILLNLDFMKAGVQLFEEMMKRGIDPNTSREGYAPKDKVAFSVSRKASVYNWVDETGGLPAYIKEIAESLKKRGFAESKAIATAVNTVKRWAKGGSASKGGKGKVTAATQAKAAAALAEWEANRAEAKANAAKTAKLAAQTAEMATITASVVQRIDNTTRERVSEPAAVAFRRHELLSQVRGEVNALTASAGIPIAPPMAWFENPRLRQPTAINIDDDGRIYGHLASWSTCHVGSPSGEGICVMAPRNQTGYAYFRTGAVKTAEGQIVPTGRLVMGGGHADTRANAVVAAAHYDSTSLAVADVVCGEDAHGIWVAGALRPDVTPKQIRTLRASPLSGDWRRIAGKLELTVGLAVNAPGLPVPRVNGLVASIGETDSEAGEHELLSLVAAGMLPPKKVLAPGTEGALSTEDLKYLRALAAREREEQRLAIIDKAQALKAKLDLQKNKAKVAAFAASRKGNS
ncbi:MAG: putative actinophage protein, partial [Labilithrix sp.]|nr:putative actinophage protein [Labilithrix sp.]